MDRVATYLAKGHQPRHTRRGSTVVLPGPGKGFVRLADAAGHLTPAGERYVHLTGQHPTGEETLVREGGTEFLVRGRARRVARRWDPVTKQWSYTAAGRAYFSRQRSEYVVFVPVVRNGRRNDGAHYNRPGYMPISDLGMGRTVSLPQDLTTAQRDERIKALVLAKIDVEKPLYEVSAEE